MKKGLKITLIVLGVLIVIITLDTMQAKIFDNSPFIKIRKEFKDGYVQYIDKGLLVNHYHCGNNKEKTTWKSTKYACPIYKKNNVTDEITKVTSEQVLKLTPSMTYKDIVEILGNTIDIGSGIYILKYEVDGKYIIEISLQGDDAELGITGDKLLENKQLINQFNLVFYQKTAIKPKQKELIIGKNEIKDIDYNVYAFEGHIAINFNSDTELTENSIPLREALLQNKITMNEILEKANEDLNKNNITGDIYKDGGSMIYQYGNYTIIKCNTLNGNRDVYIGTKDMTINDLEI